MRDLERAPVGGNGAVEADHHRPRLTEASSRVGRLLGTRGVDGSGYQWLSTIGAGSGQQ